MFGFYQLKMTEIIAVIMIKLSQYSFGVCLYSQLNQIINICAGFSFRCCTKLSFFITCFILKTSWYQNWRLCSFDSSADRRKCRVQISLQGAINPLSVKQYLFHMVTLSGGSHFCTSKSSIMKLWHQETVMIMNSAGDEIYLILPVLPSPSALDYLEMH